MLVPRFRLVSGYALQIHSKIWLNQWRNSLERVHITAANKPCYYPRRCLLAFHLDIDSGLVFCVDELMNPWKATVMADLKTENSSQLIFLLPDHVYVHFTIDCKETN